MKRRIASLCLLPILIGWMCSPAEAVTVFVNEFGEGTLDLGGGPIPLPFSLEPDPGPGGQLSVLTYNLLGPPDLVEGDVLLLDPLGGISDILRFNPLQAGGSLLFYSDDSDGINSLADGPFPTAFYANLVSIPESDFVTVYIPLPGEPGYVPGFDVTYVFQSEVPEPGTVALLAAGLALVVSRRLRRR